MLTQERLKELLDYDPDMGVFVWKVSRGRVKAGTVAGTVDGASARGYIQIRVDGKKYRAHRLAWLYTYGCWPKEEIDHINRVKDDNRLCNLREATHQKNQWNHSLYKSNTSGYAGVYLDKHHNRWKAHITWFGKTKTLGFFHTPEEAHAAYLAAKEELHNIGE